VSDPGTIRDVTITVRPARSGELPRVGQLTHDAYDADSLLPADSDYGEVLRDAASRARDAVLLVAVDGHGEVLGTVTFALPGTPYAEVSRPGEAEFRMLAVAPTARRRGIARLLVLACVERARAEGAAALVLSSSTRMTAAHRLYESLGFVRLPERDWRPIPSVELIAFTRPVG